MISLNLTIKFVKLTSHRLVSYGVYISQLVRFARCCTSVSDFNSKNLQLTSKLLTQGYRYHKLRKTSGKFLRSYYDLLYKFGEISFQEYVTEGISHPVFYGDLVYEPGGSDVKRNSSRQALKSSNAFDVESMTH